MRCIGLRKLQDPLPNIVHTLYVDMQFIGIETCSYLLNWFYISCVFNQSLLRLATVIDITIHFYSVVFFILRPIDRRVKASIFLWFSPFSSF